jgi:hypothetical protein
MVSHSSFQNWIMALKIHVLVVISMIDERVGLSLKSMGLLNLGDL